MFILTRKIHQLKTKQLIGLSIFDLMNLLTKECSKWGNITKVLFSKYSPYIII